MGSPRRNGNTELLLRKVMEGAASKGAETKTLIACRLDIAPCRHCNRCLKTGECVIEDDMQQVHRDLRDVDCIVLASPIFFLGLTAQTKTIIDRCQALWALKYVLKLPVSIPPGKARHGIWVSVAGLPWDKERLFSPARATVKAFFATLEVKFDGELTYNNVDERGAILHHPTAPQDAFLAGQRLVERTAQDRLQSAPARTT